jgi:hypothetical protein
VPFGNSSLLLGWGWRTTTACWNPGWVIVSLVYQVARKLLAVPAVLLRRDASKEAELLVLRHENAVVRVGDTVRRTAGPWTPAVHALLRHVRAEGFTQVPEPRGLDEHGREVLSSMAAVTAVAAPVSTCRRRSPTGSPIVPRRHPTRRIVVPVKTDVSMCRHTSDVSSQSRLPSTALHRHGSHRVTEANPGTPLHVAPPGPIRGLTTACHTDGATNRFIDRRYQWSHPGQPKSAGPVADARETAGRPGLADV